MITLWFAGLAQAIRVVNVDLIILTSVQMRQKLKFGLQARLHLPHLLRQASNDSSLAFAISSFPTHQLDPEAMFIAAGDQLGHTERRLQICRTMGTSLYFKATLKHPR